MTSGFDDYWDRKIRENNIPPEFGDARGIVGIEVMEVVNGNKTPEEAMASAKEQIKDLISKR